jgi:hypothetical protein
MTELNTTHANQVLTESRVYARLREKGYLSQADYQILLARLFASIPKVEPYQTKEHAK